MSGMKHPSVKYVSVLTVVYLLLGPLLLFVDNKMFGSEALLQAFPITVVAVAYFAYTLAAMSLVGKSARSGQTPLGMFLLDNVVRFFMTCIILVVYAFINRSGLVLFGINLLAYYLATLVVVTCFTVRMSRGNVSARSRKTGNS